MLSSKDVLKRLETRQQSERDRLNSITNQQLLIDLLVLLSKGNFCPGVLDPELAEFARKHQEKPLVPNSVRVSPSGEIRSNSCEVVMRCGEQKSVCSACSKSMASLKKACSRDQKKNQNSVKGTVSIHKADGYMSIDEVRLHNAAVRKQPRRLKKQNRVQLPIESQENANELIQDARDHCPDEVRHGLESEIEDGLSLWERFNRWQQKAHRCREEHGYTPPYPPYVLHVMSLIHSNNPGSLQLLGKLGIMIVPCSKTMTNYMHAKTVTKGVCIKLLENASRQLQILSKEQHPEGDDWIGRYGALATDEVKISSGLIIRKRDNQVIGLSNDYNTADEITSCLAGDEQPMEQSNPLKLSTEAAVFLFRPFFTGALLPVAFFATLPVTPTGQSIGSPL
mmetsp:Transcript_25413/g.63740  ORF Transcript_25413/g.63740 Transcript_25413/m.63740 type:complete len:395 (-) Transcript_25413:823-2007(-)